MLPLRFPIAVVIERVPLANRWASQQWRVAMVERDDNGPAPAVKLSDDATGMRSLVSNRGVLHPQNSRNPYSHCD
jgi:hypothetical protein